VFNVISIVPSAVSGELVTVYMGVVLVSAKPTEERILPLVPVAVMAFVFLFIDHVRPPPSSSVSPLAFRKKLLGSETVT
jgi:hypothetical protein